MCFIDIISICRYFSLDGKEVWQHFQWVKLYEESGDAGLVCRGCGIYRPTLRKWWKRCQAQGIDGLKSQSRRPHSSPFAKIGPDPEKLILELHGERNLGARRIQSELKRFHEISLSIASIHKVLCRHQAKPLVKYRRKKDFTRYQRPIPGERVQMDACKIAPGLYQYTAVDDYTRYRVLRVYARSTANNTLDFLDCVLEEMPFPIQCIQTDRGREFFAAIVQERLKQNDMESSFVRTSPPRRI